MTDINVSPWVPCLEQVEDPCIDRAKQHELLAILVLSVRDDWWGGSQGRD